MYLKVRDKCLVKVENALNLWIEDINRKYVPIGSNVFRQKAMSLYENFGRRSTESNTKPISASRGWLHRFKNRFGLKTIKLIEEATSADEIAAILFPAELKELITAKGYHLK